MLILHNNILFHLRYIWAWSIFDYHMNDTRPTPTPETDAEALACRDFHNQPIDYVPLCFARKLERERDKALRELQEARNTNVNVRKERGARVMELKKELHEAREALSGRTVSCSQCNKAASDIAELNQRLIDRTADMLAKVVELGEKIHRIKKSHEETERHEIGAMREAIKEAHGALSFMNELHADGHSETANHALFQLKPFLP